MSSRDVDYLLIGGGLAAANCARWLREGGGIVPRGDTVIEAGDEVLLVLDPGVEADITAQFSPNGQVE